MLSNLRSGAVAVWAGGITTHPHVGGWFYHLSLRSLMLDKWRSQIYTGAPPANEEGYKVYRGDISQWGMGGERIEGNPELRRGETGASKSIEKNRIQGSPSPTS
jgi:hypothetical protein